LSSITVYIKVDPGVGIRICAGERHQNGRRRGDRSTANDVELRALGVELSGKRVQGNSFEADEVVSGWNSSRNGRRPRRVIGNHFTVTPRSSVNGATDQARLINLEPFKRFGVNTRACRATAVGEVPFVRW
jgi:hypothetical protein